MPRPVKMTPMDRVKITHHIRLIERSVKLVKVLLTKQGVGKLAWAVGAGLVVTSVLNCPEAGYADSMREFRRATFIHNTPWGQRTVPQWR